MRKKLLNSLVAATVALSAMTSCFSDDSSEYDYYEDVSISAFSLSAVNKYTTLKNSAGEDSVVKSSVATGNYKFIIDQSKKQIYNPDSLPKGSDPEHILCSITANYAGLVALKNANNDSLKSFSTSDSIDFTTPRQFIVYNAAFNAARTYTVTVNIHNEDSLDMPWSKMCTNADIAALDAMKAVTLDNKVYVFGGDGSQTSVFAWNGQSDFTQLSTSPTLGADAYKSAIVKDETIYILSNGSVMTSSDGATWSTVGDGTSLKQLVAAGRNKIFALTETGFSSSTDGVSWTAEDIDSETAYLPANSITYTTRPSKVNPEADYITVVGGVGGDLSTTLGHSVAWTHVDDFGTDSDKQPWMLNVNDIDSLYLPAMPCVQTIYYNDSIVAVGGNSEAVGTAIPLNGFYYSGDGGINWSKSTHLALPEDIASDPSNFAVATDNDAYIWIICGKTGEVWRGKLTYAGWKKDQEVFK